MAVPTYLHLFDHNGNHVSSDVTMVGEADVLQGDIAIRLFEVQHDGVRFALVDESEPERGDWVELYPERYGFHEPWDGLYDT